MSEPIQNESELILVVNEIVIDLDGARYHIQHWADAQGNVVIVNEQRIFE